MTQEEKEKFGIKLSNFPPMILDHLNKRIETIDDEYPWTMNPNILLVIIVVSIVIWIAVIGYFLWRIYRVRSNLTDLKSVKRFVMGTADNTELMKLRSQFAHLMMPGEVLRFSDLQKSEPSTSTQGWTQVPEPPPRPKHTRKKFLETPTKDIPTKESLDYAVESIIRKGYDLKKYQDFLKKKKTSSQE